MARLNGSPRHGEWVSIVPHTLLYLIEHNSDFVAIDLLEPVHSQSVGLVLSNRDPPSPLTAALLRSALRDALQADFATVKLAV